MAARDGELSRVLVNWNLRAPKEFLKSRGGDHVKKHRLSSGRHTRLVNSPNRRSTVSRTPGSRATLLILIVVRTAAGTSAYIRRSTTSSGCRTCFTRPAGCFPEPVWWRSSSNAPQHSAVLGGSCPRSAGIAGYALLPKNRRPTVHSVREFPARVARTAQDAARNMPEAARQAARSVQETLSDLPGSVSDFTEAVTGTGGGAEPRQHGNDRR